MGKTEVTWDEFDAFRAEEAVEAPEDNDKRIKADADALTGPTKPYADETFTDDEAFDALDRVRMGLNLALG